MNLQQIGDEDGERRASSCIVPAIHWTTSNSVHHVDENVQQLPACYSCGGGRLTRHEETCLSPTLPGH